MDFMVGLPHTEKQYESIWLIVDRLTKYACFIPVNSTYSAEDYARIFIDNIVCRHSIPLSIISDRGAQFFISRFWRSLQQGLGTKEKLSTTFHSQIHGPSERTIQNLEICLELVSLISRKIGISICLWWSLLAIIVSIHPYPWLLIKSCIVGGVGLLLDRSKLVNLHFAVPI